MSSTNGPKEADMVETDLLIIGAGPAGASLAAFLASHGLKAIMISNAPGTSETPRAHLINMAGMECLRDIDVEEEAMKLGALGDAISVIRWCRSMVGEEFGRIQSWGYSPEKMGEVAAASPCNFLDLPQTLLEPILVKHATHHGISVLFNTTLVDFSRDAHFAITTVRNNVTQHTFRIRSRYLFGCDGARSSIARGLNLSFNRSPSGGAAYNILLNADLTDVLKYNKGHLHWIMRPESDHKFGSGPVFRMVKPWRQWLLVCFPQPGVKTKGFEDSPETNVELINFVKDVIGDDKIEVEILGVSKWTVNEAFAETYSDGNTFCLGDAVHRHPPTFGLGSNTCIQDAFNLAWKIAYVLKGIAGPSLLDSYTSERQPVGQTVVVESNKLLREAHAKVWEALGILGESIEERVKMHAELSELSERGRERRALLSAAIDRARHEGDSLGITMNQWYTSKAIYLKDEDPRPPFTEDPITNLLVSTYPGTRLPHAWLSRPVPSKPISTIDLAGKGAFCLLTGNGGDAWRQAAKRVGKTLGVPINVFSIGFGLEYRDMHRDWQKRREIEEDGCVLVRPDRYVAWRSKTMISSSCEEKLLLVLKAILSL